GGEIGDLLATPFGCGTICRLHFPADWPRLHRKVFAVPKQCLPFSWLHRAAGELEFLLRGGAEKLPVPRLVASRCHDPSFKVAKKIDKSGGRGWCWRGPGNR